MLALGAGVYEELVFRGLLFGVSALALRRLKFPGWFAYVVAALFSSIAFSWFHYLGGEPFTFFPLFSGFWQDCIFVYCFISADWA